jgi:hypothetical protein
MGQNMIYHGGGPFSLGKRQADFWSRVAVKQEATVKCNLQRWSTFDWVTEKTHTDREVKKEV